MAITPVKYCPKEYALIAGEYIPEAEKLIAKGLRPYIYDFYATKAVSATAVEFISGGINTALNVQAAGCHKKIAVISASTDDHSKGTATIVSLKVLGIDSNHNYNLVTATMSGTTSASATTTLYEVTVAYSNVFGTSAQNAKGSIKVSMTGKTSKAVLDIVSGQNVSVSSRVWAPKNWYGKILSVKANFVTQVVSGDQAQIFPQYYDAYSNKNFDGSHDKVGFAVGGAQFNSDSFPRTYGNATTNWKVSFYGIATATETLGIAVRMLLWADTPSLASGQFKYIVGE
jgi:hypothetical protein